jgi:tetratricopeptide (TPR) repeat protein
MASRTQRKSAPQYVPFGVCIALALLIWIVFGQTLHHEFTNYDDTDYVTRNAQVGRGLTWEGFAWAFTHLHAANWHPLTWLSHMLDAQFYGINAGGHHLTNLILHSATTILLFLFVRQMTGALWRSAFVAALFAIHPLHVESVAWVAERKDVLSGLFFVLTLMAYVRYTRAADGRRYGLTLLFFALGLMAKPMLVSVPVILLLLDYWPLARLPSLGLTTPEERKTAWRLLREKLPFIILVAASCVVTLLAQREAIVPATGLDAGSRFANAIVAYLDYICQMIWPKDLAVFYPWDAARLGIWHVSLAMVVIVGMTVAAILLGRRRYFATGWLWYFIMLVPVIGILQVGYQARADRYTYLPQIGLHLLIAWGAVDIAEKLRVRRVWLGALAGAVIIILTFVAHTQAGYWKNSEMLWTHAVACTKTNALAELNLGEALQQQGRNREARAHFETSLLINRNQPGLLAVVGEFYQEEGRITEALQLLNEAIAQAPNDQNAHYNLGNLYLQIGNAKEALDHYRRALELNQDDTEAMNNMAWILATWPDALFRDGLQAVSLAERADTLTRGQSQIISATLAAAYAETARFDEAIKAAQRAINLATAEGKEARAASIREQLETYKSRRAFRDRRRSG